MRISAKIGVGFIIFNLSVYAIFYFFSIDPALFSLHHYHTFAAFLVNFVWGVSCLGMPLFLGLFMLSVGSLSPARSKDARVGLIFCASISGLLFIASLLLTLTISGSNFL